MPQTTLDGRAVQRRIARSHPPGLLRQAAYRQLGRSLRPFRATNAARTQGRTLPAQPDVHPCPSEAAPVCLAAKPIGPG